jgi:hypothetical protein
MGELQDKLAFVSIAFNTESSSHSTLHNYLLINAHPFFLIKAHPAHAQKINIFFGFFKKLG